MRKSIHILARNSYLLASLLIFNSGAYLKAEMIDSGPAVKEWTFLIYLNGDNNLDSFGKMNIEQMEKVGSSADINIVVQWASLANKKTERLYVIRGQDPQNVTSPVLQDMGQVDMGDWHSVVDFVSWGAAHFPARHYFVDIWDHGSGWHAIETLEKTKQAGLHIFDISWDDNTGHSITTQQLGTALNQAAQIIGHKIDLYASDACMMGMAEVANEVVDSVQVYGGSEEVEPGQGWPYDTFLTRWIASPRSTAAEVAAMLTEEYVKSYSNGENGTQSATFAAYDLSKMGVLDSALFSFGQALMKLDANNRAQFVKAAGNAQSFSYSDYVDLMDLLSVTESAKLSGMTKEVTGNVRNALSRFLIAHDATSDYSNAQGVSIWVPTDMSSYQPLASQYSALKFESQTHWGDALAALLQ